MQIQLKSPKEPELRLQLEKRHDESGAQAAAGSRGFLHFGRATWLLFLLKGINALRKQVRLGSVSSCSRQSVGVFAQERGREIEKRKKKKVLLPLITTAAQWQTCDLVGRCYRAVAHVKLICVPSNQRLQTLDRLPDLPGWRVLTASRSDESKAPFTITGSSVLRWRVSFLLCSCL